MFLRTFYTLIIKLIACTSVCTAAILSCTTGEESSRLTLIITGPPSPACQTPQTRKAQARQRSKKPRAVPGMARRCRVSVRSAGRRSPVSNRETSPASSSVLLPSALISPTLSCARQMFWSLCHRAQTWATEHGAIQHTRVIKETNQTQTNQRG